MDHPLVHLMAVLVRVVDPGDGLAFRDQFFDAAHPSLEPVNRSLHLDITVGPNRLDMAVEVGIKGRIGRDLDARALALLSRAVHKIAFENLAWSSLVAGTTGAPDLYSSEFEPVRRWVRRGAPPRPVRAMLWMMQDRGTMEERAATEFGSQVWRFGEDWAIDVDLLNQRYAVSLTSAPSRAKEDLLKWIGAREPDRLVITDIMESVASAAPSVG